MLSPMKLCKHVEDAESGDCLDRISSFPDDVLVDVLSFLPTTCAVSTSVLSTRWKHLYTLVNCLSFDDSSLFSRLEKNKGTEEAQKRMFKKFVYNVLKSHQVSPLRKFTLVCRGKHDKSDLNAWVRTAIQKGVQDLHYRVAVHEMPDELYKCKTLVRLKISDDFCTRALKVPVSPYMPSLKILHLEGIVFGDYDSVEILFSACELLEELALNNSVCFAEGRAVICTRLLQILTVESCFFFRGLFEITAPNLAHLTYRSNMGVKIVPSWEYSNSLAQAKLKFVHQDSLENDIGLIKAVAYKVTELHLLAYSLKFLPMLADQGQMPTFHSLSRLYLQRRLYQVWKCVTSLLDKSPQLETLVFQEGSNHDPTHFDCDLESPPDEDQHRFKCHAKVIEVNAFSATKYELSCLRHLLRNAGVLKKLILYRYSDVSEEKLQMGKDLLMQSAPKDCYIELKSSTTS